MSCRMKLRGGQTTNYQFVILALLVAHIVLASLMWSDAIQFATNDTKVVTATSISVIAVFLAVFAIYLKN